MTYYKRRRVEGLFPELADSGDVRLLLAEVSGIDISTIPSPVFNVVELCEVAPVSQVGDSSEYIGFDNFARRICLPDKVIFQKTFESVDISSMHASSLANAAWLNLVEQVQQVSVRTLIAAMHILRENGKLQGNSSEERYQYFCRLSASGDFEDRLLRVFPELGNQISFLRNGAIAKIQTFLDRLDKIKSDDRFQEIVGCDLTLCSLSDTGSDSHVGGQTVLIAEFDGGSKRIIYKPRRMAAEVGFARLIERFNQRASTCLPTLRTVDANDHGWQEFANGKKGGEGSDNYFRKCGHLLAILQLMGASDMHFENVLNHEFGPVVVDAETLFSVNMRRDEGGDKVNEAMVALAESVFSTGFLPSRIESSDGSVGSVDIGFLGYEPGQTAITPSVMFRDIGTDLMSVDFGLGEIIEPSIVPSVSASPNAPKTISVAFGELYDWISKHKEEVLGWISDLFEGVHVRAVLDNTRKYYQLLSLATHPEFQMSSELTTVLFHRCGIGRRDHVTSAVVRAEIRDLKNRDVPYFTLRTDKTVVYDSRYQVIADPLANPPLEGVRKRVEEMSECKRNFNIRTIESSFVGKTSDVLDRPSWEHRHQSITNSVSSQGISISGALDEFVRMVAEQYAQFAIRPRDGSPTEWLGATLSNTAQEHPWRYRQLSDGLYAGRSGLSLFLTAASQRLGETKYADIAEEFLLPRAHQLINGPLGIRQSCLVGGMGDGYPGIAYTLINGGRMTGRKEWEDTGFELLRFLQEDVTCLNDSDQLMGAAGILSFVGQLLGDPLVSKQDLGLLRTVSEKAFGILRFSEEQSKQDKRVFSGFAHGLAGSMAASSIFGLYNSTAKMHLDRLTQRFISLFENGKMKWTISNEASDRRARGWCHGVPGILTGELVLIRNGHSTHGQRIEEMAEVVADECFDLNFSLCHGDIGNLMILQQAGKLLGRDDLLNQVNRTVSSFVGEIVPRAAARSNAKTFLNDAFMVGLPGVAYGLMYLQGDGLFPNVLDYSVVR